MITIFVGGHGRCDEQLPCAVPAKVAINWFGKQGNPVTKRFSGAVLRGALTVMSGLSSKDYPPCEHYTCESMPLENEGRARHFLSGPWNANTYLIQARAEFTVPLSQLLTFAQQRWPGETIEFKWAVCRSSVRYSGLVGHDYASGNAGVEKPRENTAPSPVPANRIINNVPGAIHLQQWGKSLLNYGTATKAQIDTTLASTKVQSKGGYVLV